MRLVQISVANEQREAMVDVIEDHGLGYTLTPGADGQSDQTHVTFVVPADAVEHVLADLTAAGYDRSTFTTSVQTEFASFAGVDDVQDKWAETPNRIAPATLRSKAKDMRSNTRSYMWMMGLASVVATAGLLISSPAVVVGSMVIAPIVGPMLTASIGAVRNDRAMVVDSVQQQAMGLGFAFLGSIVFALVVKHGFAVPTTLAVSTMELVSMRLSPSLLSITVGFTAGAAGAYGLATKGNVSIVGVMIAAALIPSAAAAGIGVAWGNLVLGAGALVLLITSVSAVNLGAYAMLRYLEYRPDDVGEGWFTVPGQRRTVTIAVTALFVVAAVLTVGVGAYQQVSFDRTVNTVATDVLTEERYQSLAITSVRTEYVGIGSGSGPTAVTLTLRRQADRAYPDVAAVLDRRLSERVDTPVTVQVRFVDYRVSDQETAASVSRSPTLGHQSWATSRR